MAESNTDLLKQEIRSLLISAKNGLTEWELLNDYRMFNSKKDLPFKTMGFSTLFALLRSWPDVCRIQQQTNNGLTKIFAVEDENTKHILSMVRGQRNRKNRRRGGGGGRGGARGGRGAGRGARFSQAAASAYNYRPGGSGRGAASGRIAYNNSRSDRSLYQNTSALPARVSGQNSNNKSNFSVPPRFGKQQPQQNKVTITGLNQDPRQSSNAYNYDDRRVTNNSESLRVTIPNNNSTGSRNNNNVTTVNNDYSYPSQTGLRIADYELPEDEEQVDEEEDYDNEEEVANNLQALLTEHSHGIRLLALENIYQKKFGKNLLDELHIENILLLQEFVEDFASISRQDEENGSCDHIITLKDPKQVAQSKAHLLQQITASGIVPKIFSYANNLMTYINDTRFQGYVSDVDKNEHCLHIQPARFQEHIETLMEELDSYYSSSISNSLIVKNVETGLACVTKYDGVYHRVFIKESDLYKCVLVYVDYGTTEEIDKEGHQFKHLLQHFAVLPCMAIGCRLDDVRFLPSDEYCPPETYKELYALCQGGPFFIEPNGYTKGLLNVKILDADERCLNDIVVEMKLAVKVSTFRNPSPSTDNSQQIKPTAPKPVVLSFDHIMNAATHCPLPDSEPSSPECAADDPHSGFSFELPQKVPSSTASQSSTAEYQCKLIQIDENNSFYLVRYIDNKPLMPCFDVARLFRLSESDILAEPLLSRDRVQLTTEYRSLFEFFKKSNPKDCLHIHQGLLFLFDLSSMLKVIEQPQHHQTIHNELANVLHQQINAAKEPNFWKSGYDCYQRPISTALSLSVQSKNQTDAERYSELLTRRNMLCDMLRVTNVSDCTLELEAIENELQQLIEKMRFGVSQQQQQQKKSDSSVPPGFNAMGNNEIQRSTTTKVDKLKDMMQRCKTLINTILVLDDYVELNDSITDYIQANLPFLNAQTTSNNDEYLYDQYAQLSTNLTIIVDQLRAQLPTGILPL